MSLGEERGLLPGHSRPTALAGPAVMPGAVGARGGVGDCCFSSETSSRLLSLVVNAQPRLERGRGVTREQGGQRET